MAEDAGETPETPLQIDEDGWLIAQPELHARRAPGRTCIHALSIMEACGEIAQNDSKGCGGVMRMAPAGLFGARAGHAAAKTFELGCELSGLTHGHPTGRLTAGVLAVIIAGDLRWRALGGGARRRHRDSDHQGLPHRNARLAGSGTSARCEREATAPRLSTGEGPIAEEALAIAVYCALVASASKTA